MNSFNRYFSFGSSHWKCRQNPKKLVAKNFILKFNEVERFLSLSKDELHQRILYLNFIQSVMACLNFQNVYFRKHLLMAAFIRFRSTCFSEHLKVDALFIKQPSYFLLGIFLFKKYPQKTRSFILTSMRRGNSIIAFHHYFLRRHSSKLFLTDET